MRKLFYIIFILSNLIVKAQETEDGFINNLAFSIPSKINNAKELSSYVNIDTLSNREKLQVLFVWITENIDYDVESFISGLRNSPYPETTLEEGKAICFGYAVLFDSVCQYLKIPSRIVTGYTKSGYNPRSSDHAWNVVKLDGQWLFVDCTWGSGKVNTVSKRNIIQIILQKPTLNGKTEFIEQRNYQYFLASAVDMLETHLPADPLWQLREYPITLECFMNDVKCDSFYIYFNYVDTLKNYNKLSSFEKNIASYKRANNFNPLNFYDLASAYVDHGFFHFNIAENTVPSSIEYIKKKLDLSSENFSKGYQSLELGRHIDDSIYRYKLNKFKSDYKINSASIKDYQKVVTKSISNNQKLIERRETEKEKIKDKLASMRGKAVKTLIDDKIYATKRSHTIPGHSDSLKFITAMHRADSLYSLADEIVDTIQYTMTKELQTIYDSILNIKNLLPEIIYTIEEINEALQKLIIENSPETFNYTDSIITISDHIFATMENYQDLVTTMVKYELKEKHGGIKANIKELESVLKESKRYLIECKKSSFVDQDEEEKYIACNEMFYSINVEYKERLNHEIVFFKTIKEPIKKENKLYQHYLKGLKRTNNLLEQFYNFQIAQMKTRYTNEKNYIKQTAKQVNKAERVCVKMLGEYNKDKQ